MWDHQIIWFIAYRWLPLYVCVVNGMTFQCHNKFQFEEGVSTIWFFSNWLPKWKCQIWWWLHPYLQWCVLQRWIHQTLCWTFARIIFYCTFVKWAFLMKYKWCEERKCVIYSLNKQRKHKGMGWIKHWILKDQERPFMFQDVLKVWKFLKKTWYFSSHPSKGFIIY